MHILQLAGITKAFGGITAISNLDLSVERGAIHGVIGPNGAGKTTLFSLIGGFYRPTVGSVLFEGEDITGLPVESIARRGLVRTFQRVAVFHDRTVLENVVAALHLHTRVGFLDAVLGSGPAKRASEERAREILDFIQMVQLCGTMASNLAHGHQRMLGIAIALAAGPKLLMLDEPVAGMNLSEKVEATRLIRRLRDDWGITVLLVEHDMRTVMSLCDRITVLSFGRRIAEGSPRDVQEQPEVIEAYLGREEDFAQA